MNIKAILSIFCVIITVVGGITITPSASAEEPSLDQYCHIEDDCEIIMYSTNIFAQSFIPTKNFLIKIRVKLSLFNFNNEDIPITRLVIVGLTDSLSPSGLENPLATGARSVTTISDNPTWYNLNIDDPIELDINKEYYIIVKLNLDINPNEIYWHGSHMNEYANGQAYQSTDSGETWIDANYCMDLNFETWGYNTNSNNPPSKPETPSGPSTGYTNLYYEFSTSTTDPNNDNIRYGWDWNGDGNIDEWTNFFESGEKVTVSHSFSNPGTYHIKVMAEDIHGAQSSWSTKKTVTITSSGSNAPPNKPEIPSGSPYGGVATIPFGFYTTTSDPEGDEISFRFDWGDGSPKIWTDYYPSGSYVSKKHIWDTSGEIYEIRVQAKDIHGAESEWSDPLLFEIFPFEEDTVNNPPNKPSTPIGPANVESGKFFNYKTVTSDQDGDRVQYLWDITGDYIFNIPTIFFESGDEASVDIIWPEPGVYELRVKAVDDFLNESEWSNSLTVNVIDSSQNRAPNIPKKPVTITQEGYVRDSYPFSTWADDPDGDNVQYFFDWGDGTNSGWIGDYKSGETCVTYKNYENSGIYIVRVKARDDPNNDGDFTNGLESEYSEYFEINIKGDKSSTIFYPIANDPKLRYDASYMDHHQTWFSTTDDFFNWINCSDTGMIGTVSLSSGFLPMPWTLYGDSWTEAGIRKDFYVGREKNLIIEAEIDYTASAVAWMLGNIGDFVKNYFVYHIGEFNPDTKVREAINFNVDSEENVIWNYIEALAAILTSVGFKFIKPIVQEETNYENFHIAYESVRIKYADALKSMEENAKTWYDNFKMTIKNYMHHMGLTLSKLIFSIGLVLILVSFIFYLGNGPSYIDLNAHFDDLKKEGFVDSKTIKIADQNFNTGDHSIWFGLESKTFTPIFASGMAYTAGIVKNIRITGISAPDKPSIISSDINYVNSQTEIKVQSIDYNNDPVKYIINWGDGTNTVTAFFKSGEEASVNNRYTSPGTYTITIKAEDCDKMQSKPNSIEINVIKDIYDPVVSITHPGNYLYMRGDEKVSLSFPVILFGDITIKADAYDAGSGIDYVEFIIDGRSVKKDYDSPYNYHWDSKGFGRNIQVRAVDKTGKEVVVSLLVFYIKII